MDQRLKQEFPVDWDDDHFVTRREFFKFITLASGGIAFGTSAIALYSALPKSERSFDPARICSLEEIKPGSSKPFNYPRPSDLCLLVRKQNGELVAYNRRCTHLSCPVDYKVHDEKEVLYCPCHNGVFSLEDGSVLMGPPPHAIPRIKIEERDGEIWAVGAYIGEHV